MIHIPRILLSLIFISAALLKLANLEGFAAGIHSFQFFPLQTEWFLAHALPTLELICAVALMTKPYSRPSALLLTLLASAFSALYAISISRNIDPNCGCFGSFLLVTPTQGLFRALSLTALSLITYWTTAQPLKLTEHQPI
jgi:uncharacterized membrane protein YphA (DoxX/SURF4 family)